jgi:FkbM family methyltransferase
VIILRLRNRRMNLLKKLFKQNTHNPIFGSIASVGRSFNRLYENRNHDIHTNGEVWLVKRVAQTSPRTIFDVGANTGKYCNELLKYCPGATIYCFEPVSKTFTLLQSAVKSDKVMFVQKGLFSEDKKLTINLYPSHTHASLFELKAVPYQSVGTEVIDLVRGDKFIDEQSIKNIDLLKLDIEGAELGALTGLERSFREKKIRVVQFEYGYINITTKNLLIDYYEFFESVGYEVGKLYPKHVDFRNYKFKHEDFIGPNFVAVQKGDNDVKRLLK